MRWIIRNALTEDVLESFDKEGRPKWVSDSPKRWKWFKKWSEVTLAVSLIQKCGDECYPVSLESEK
jgi:hypothetical protein